MITFFPARTLIQTPHLRIAHLNFGLRPVSSCIVFVLAPLPDPARNTGWQIRGKAKPSFDSCQRCGQPASGLGSSPGDIQPCLLVLVSIARSLLLASVLFKHNSSDGWVEMI